MNTKLEEDFFDFVSERVLFVGNASAQEETESLDKMNAQMKGLVGAEIWGSYQAKLSIETDQMMLIAYKKGFFDALQLYGI